MLRALVETGPVITSAGLILAGTFARAGGAADQDLIAIGFAVAFGVLVDTFVVRSICVPAIVVARRRPQLVAVTSRPGARGARCATGRDGGLLARA